MTEEIKDETYFRLKEEYLSKLKRLKQENEKLLKARNHFMAVNLKYFTALEEIQRVINLAYKVEDYQFGQDYTDLVDRNTMKC